MKMKCKLFKLLKKQKKIKINKWKFIKIKQKGIK